MQAARGFSGTGSSTWRAGLPAPVGKPPAPAGHQSAYACAASPSAAGNAGWALFALLLSLSVLVVFGLLGDLWSVLGFILPLGVLILVTLLLFVLLYRTASTGRHRGRRPARR